MIVRGLRADVVIELDPPAAYSPNDSPAMAASKLGKLFRGQAAKKLHLARMRDEMFRTLCQSPGDNPRDRPQDRQIIIHSSEAFARQRVAATVVR